MTGLRRVAYPLRLAAARLAARGDRALLVVGGTAAGAAILAAVLAGSLVARDRSLARATEAIPAAQGVVKASWFGVPSAGEEPEAALDRQVRSALSSVSAARATEAVTFRRSTLGGRFIALAAADGLRPWLEVTSGRLPRTCGPERCEVVQIGGHGRIPHTAGLPLVRVGTARLRSSALFGEFFTPSSDVFVRRAVGYHQPPTPPLLVAEGVDQAVALPEVSRAYRSYAWLLPVAPGSVHPWTVDRFAADVQRARSSIITTNESAWDLQAPVLQLAEAASRAEVSGRRLLLVGGEAAALLLAFAALAASAMRRDALAARRRLTWFGARRWQIELLTLTEAAGLALAGAVLGWVLGIGIAVIVARSAGSPVGGTLRSSVLSGGGLAAAAALAASAALVVVAAVRSGRSGAGRGISPVDVAAVGALAVVVVGLLRGEAGSEALAAGRGTGVFLILLPGLITFVAAVVLARSLPLLLLGLQRLVRGRSVPLRMAVLSLARNPGHAGVAVAFLVVSLGLGLFAETYRSTLVRGQTDQAAYAYPSDYVLREPGSEPVRLADVATPAALGGLPAGTRTASVFRLAGNAGLLESGASVSVLGAPADALAGMAGWRSDFASSSLAGLVSRIRPRGSTAMTGPVLPADGVRLDLPARGRPVSLTASVRTPSGGFAALELGTTTRRGGTLHAEIPPNARGGRIVALTLNPGTRLEDRGADAGKPFFGSVRLGRPSVDAGGTSIAVAVDYRRWIGVERVRPAAAHDSAVLRYTLTNEAVSRFRPRQPTDGRLVPVIASPGLVAAASSNGHLPLQIADQTLVVRIVGTASRFPTLSGEFVVADGPTLATALNTALPGGTLPSEIWLDPPAGAGGALETATSTGPLAPLVLSSREGYRATLAADPLAHGALLTLSTAALVALALALAGLLLGVVSDLRDERGELFDLESQGADPAALRRQALLRAGLVAAIGLLGGLATAAILGTLVVDLVRVTANAGSPQPPLHLALDWLRVVVAVAAYALAAGALVALATRRAVRSRGTPVRAFDLEGA